MPSWSEVLEEFKKAPRNPDTGFPDIDGIRRRHLAALALLTGRNTIVYATAWITRSGSPELSINLQDVQGLMETCRRLPGPDLDIILHSPGGTAEATASVVAYLRQKYTHIRVFVPLAAMSAATMWALAADRIVMGKHSQLGPIDPQVTVPIANGQITVPARTLIEQFNRAKDEIAQNERYLGAWAPVISQYAPGLLEVCEKADDLGKGLVKDWLAQYMFHNDDDAEDHATRVADFFGNYALHKSHNIGIFRDACKAQNLTIDDLEDDPALQDAVLTVFHATTITLSNTGCLKFIENNLGRGFYVNLNQGVPQQQLVVPQQPQPPLQQIPNPVPPLASLRRPQSSRRKKKRTRKNKN